MNNHRQFFVLGGTANHDLDRAVLDKLNDRRTGERDLTFSHLMMDSFADSEPDFRIHDPREIGDKHVLIFQSVQSGEHAEQFLTLVWACKHQYGAASITAIIPFMRFRRQDHEEKIHEINRNRMFCQMMAAMGVDRIVFCDVHSHETIDNCRRFQIEAHDADPTPAFAAQLYPCVDQALRDKRPIMVYAPDAGSIRRALRLSEVLNIPVAAAMKKRLHTGETASVYDDDQWEKLQEKHGDQLIKAGDIPKGAILCIREDEVASGGTARKAGWYLRKELGAHSVHFCATHAVLVDGWRRTFIDESPFEMILLGDTIHRSYPRRTGGRVTEVSMARVLADKLNDVMESIK